jgi:hypothetical protein
LARCLPILRCFVDLPAFVDVCARTRGPSTITVVGKRCLHGPGSAIAVKQVYKHAIFYAVLWLTFVGR